MPTTTPILELVRTAVTKYVVPCEYGKARAWAKQWLSGEVHFTEEAVAISCVLNADAGLVFVKNDGIATWRSRALEAALWTMAAVQALEQSNEIDAQRFVEAADKALA